MVGKLVGQFRDLPVEPGCLAMLWLGQAGFVCKTPGCRIITQVRVLALDIRASVY